MRLAEMGLAAAPRCRNAWPNQALAPLIPSGSSVARRWGCLGLLLVSSLSALAAAEPVVERIDHPVDFGKEVFPVLQKRCFECHGPEKQKAQLRLDGRAAALKGGKSGSPFVPGKSRESLLFQRVAGIGGEDQMPPKGEKLTAVQLGLIAAWIDQGASWPTNFGAELNPRKHWAYVPPMPTPLPRVQNSRWARNPIDQLVLARLEQEGLKPSPEASRTILIRRVSLDLIGLPPSPAEVDAFLRDDRPGAYERLVDRLLASPHYGERWARPWLDMGRYADTNGYEKDDRRSNWPYRDWVIRALNRDLPFDEFTVEQVAGDLLPDATQDQKIATGFHRNTMVNTEGGTDDEEFRTAAIIDRVNTTFDVWMGTTIGCCQCHNHKYDPFTQKEYYQVFAFFNQTRDTGRSNSPELDLPNPAQAAKRAELKAKIEPLEMTLKTQTPELDALQAKWEAQAQDAWKAIEPSWSPLQADSLEATEGVTLEKQADGSILAGGQTPDGSVYTVGARTSATNITAVRVQALADPRLPKNGPGRSENGNFILSEVLLQARPSQITPSAPLPTPTLSAWRSIGPFFAESMDDAFNKSFPPENEIDFSKSYQDGKLRWVERPEFTDGKVQTLTGDNAATYLFRTITAAQAMPLMVSLGSDDGIQGWLNGEKVLSKNVARAAEPDQESVRLELKQGDNRLLLKINNGGGDYGFYFATSGNQDDLYKVKFERAYADVAIERFEAGAAIDGDGKTGWANGDLSTTNGLDHEAVFIAQKPFGSDQGTRLTLRLRQETEHKQHLLGRFRLSFSTAPQDALIRWSRLPLAQRARVLAPADKRSDKDKEALAEYYRSIDPGLDKVREQLSELKKQEPNDVPSTLVMEAIDKPRTTHIFKRGSFLNPGDEVSADVPAVLHPFPGDQPRNRLSFARWLTDPANPLVGRVTMNRIWALYFGRGLVETSEDFGLQGEPPSHPQLLDWLALELVRQHWSLKAMHRLIVTSATYRQDSRVSPDLYLKDPFNRLFARGPRFRIEAELVRDNALAISGLLNSKIGGASVFPFQPEGVWSNPYSEDKWSVNTNGDQFRRGLYTFWRRTAPYAAFLAFDAPSREVCCERRPRTNTPLQALVTLNDPAYVVAAEALARRLMTEGGSDDAERLSYAFKCCVARPPTPAEQRQLLDLFRSVRRRLETEPARANSLVSGSLPATPKVRNPSELAAWTVVANVLLNLDETLTKG